MSIINQNNVTVTQNGAIVNGNNCTVIGDNCIINGNNCNVTGDHCIVNGSNCTINGDYCTTNGANYIVDGNHCCGNGFNQIIYGDHWQGNGSYSTAASSGVTFHSAASTFHFNGNESNLLSKIPSDSALTISHPHHPSVPVKPATSSLEKKEFPVKKEPVEAKDDDPNTCDICMVNQRDVLLIPCGHIMCVVCAHQMWDKRQCPNCREKINNVNQAFF